MKSLLVLLLMLPSLSQAQISTGVPFEHILTWSQIQQKAKSEKKYIFIDFYATECATCQWMNNEVFAKKRLGRFMSDQFVSVQVPSDLSESAPEELKAWRAETTSLWEKYHVRTIPTYVFLSPDGEPVSEVPGNWSEETSGRLFAAAAADALDPSKQYYSLLRLYREGSRDPVVMNKLIRSAQSLGSKAVALEVANDYFGVKKDAVFKNKDDVEFLRTYHRSRNAIDLANNYISTIRIATQYNKDNIELIQAFTSAPTDPGFALFVQNGEAIDAAMEKKGYAQQFVDSIVYVKEIQPILLSASKTGDEPPDWRNLQSQLSSTYGEREADRVILNGKVLWYYALYQSKKRWSGDFLTAVIALEERDDLSDVSAFGVFTDNNVLEEAILRHCEDKVVLSKAVRWMMERVVQQLPIPGATDVYAGLLYKSGKVKEGIAWMEMTLKLQEYELSKRKEEFGDDGYHKMLEELLGSMKRGEALNYSRWEFN